MKKTLGRIYILIIMLFLYLPIFALIVLSFNESKSMSVWGGFSLRWYQELFRSRIMMGAIANTFSIAILAALIATVVGTFAVLGMAAMIEGRDNSTGGHIRRTSDVVKILLDEIEKDTSDDGIKLSKRFCHNLIKAAPMHDLGKIAVDDAILRKPGIYNSEEYEIMKIHAAEGARIVREILKETDDKEFKIIAENVAHYHHERWDGSGYPEGLKGEEIPIEARIMAVADVYDALVSKRFYKEKLSFEEADKIILEGMGQHFDKRLEKYYVAARPKLEEYYKNHDEASSK